VSQEQFEAVRKAIESGHTNTDKAFKTLYLGGGADVQVIGSSIGEIDLGNVQGAGETRIAVASGVPAPLLSIAEGLEGSALNAGNYGAARRQFADSVLRPLWRNVCAAFETLVPRDPGVRLWINVNDIEFLQEDVMDAAEIKAREAQTMESLIRAGYEPVSARDAVMTGDWAKLVHTGLVSVQLLPPGTTGEPVADPAPARSLELEVVEDRRADMVEMVELMRSVIPAGVQIRADHMTVEQREDVIVNVQPTPVTSVNSPPIVNLPASVINVDAPVVNLPAPVVNVDAPVVNLPAPVVNVDARPVPMRHRVKRDGDGNIVETIEEPV
jgi:hypothetical protein